jgi:hypothetical protein
MALIAINDEARQYLELILPGISQYLDYSGHGFWRGELDIDLLAVILQNSLRGESLSDTIIRGVRTKLGLKPH